MAKIEECFRYKETWFAVKEADVDRILSCCPELKFVREAGWKGVLAERTEKWKSRVMLSGPYDGGVFLVGNALWDFTDGYAFAKAVQNKIVRLVWREPEKCCGNQRAMFR